MLSIAIEHSCLVDRAASAKEQSNVNRIPQRTRPQPKNPDEGEARHTPFGPGNRHPANIPRKWDSFAANLLGGLE
jgi:hypothetical protein